MVSDGIIVVMVSVWVLGLISWFSVVNGFCCYVLLVLCFSWLGVGIVSWWLICICVVI